MSTNHKVMSSMSEDYNKLNKSQSTVWRIAKPLFHKALQDMNVIENCNHFRVADFGCATGGNSVAPLSYVSNCVNCDYMEAYLVDLPENSWTAVVSSVTPEVLNPNRKVSVYMVRRSFYECCTAPETIDLSYSFVAIHWMQSYACDFGTGIYATDPLHNSNPTSLQAWKEAARRDFEAFTTARYKELKVGGFLVNVIACRKTNDYPWSKLGKLLFDKLSPNLPPEALAACVLPCSFRTEEEVRAGFDARWRVEYCEFHETKDPVREAFQRGEMTPMEYAKTTMDAWMAVSRHTLLQSMAKVLPVEESRPILEDASQKCLEEIANDPDQYNLDLSFFYVLAKKIC